MRSRYLKVALSIVVEGDCLLRTDTESNESMARLVTSMDVLNFCKLDWHILPLGFMTDSLQMVGSKRVDISNGITRYLDFPRSHIISKSREIKVKKNVKVLSEGKLKILLGKWKVSYTSGGRVTGSSSMDTSFEVFLDV